EAVAGGGDTHRTGPRLGYGQAQQVADDDKDHTPVKQRGAKTQQLRSINLRPVRGPSEQIRAQTPEDTDEESHYRQPRECAPEEIFKVFHGESPSLEEMNTRTELKGRRVGQ